MLETSGTTDPRHARSWFITGVCGTVGRELLEQAMALQPQAVVGIDNDESELFFLQDAYRGDQRVNFHLADIRDLGELTTLMGHAEIVLHAAAYKHVMLCERSPHAAIQTNILGTQNVIAAALASRAQRVLFTSSDKAVNPTNVMGTSKLMGERLITATNAQEHAGGRIFASTRFGNVLGSSGSVIPIFRRQIAKGGPVTLTGHDMTRFIMTLKEAVGLVMESVFMANGGEVFVTKMPVLRIVDLAEVMIEELAPRHGFDPQDVRIDVIGGKPGEKHFEELMNEEEQRRAININQYYVIKPAFLSLYRDIDYVYDSAQRPTELDGPYNSNNIEPMSKNGLRDYLRRHGYFDDGDD